MVLDEPRKLGVNRAFALRGDENENEVIAKVFSNHILPPFVVIPMHKCLHVFTPDPYENSSLAIPTPPAHAVNLRPVVVPAMLIIRLSTASPFPKSQSLLADLMMSGETQYQAQIVTLLGSLMGGNWKNWTTLRSMLLAPGIKALNDCPPKGPEACDSGGVTEAVKSPEIPVMSCRKSPGLNV